MFAYEQNHVAVSDAIRSVPVSSAIFWAANEPSV